MTFLMNWLRETMRKESQMRLEAEGQAAITSERLDTRDEALLPEKAQERANSVFPHRTLG